MIHTPHEPPLEFQRKRNGEDRRAWRTRGTTRVAPRAARDTSYPSYAGAQRRRMSTKVHGTTPAWAREPGRRDNGLANDVRVLPTDEGAGAASGEEASHAAQRPRAAASGSPPSSHRRAGNQCASNQNRGERAPNAHRAEEWCPADLLLGAPGVGVISKPMCGEVSPHGPGVTSRHMPAHPTRIVWTTSARWTSFCMHLGLVPPQNKHTKMSPRKLANIDHGSARDICI